MDLYKLFLRALNGDQDAEAQMVAHLRARFTLIAKRRVGQADAEDVAHDACLTILDKFKELDSDTRFEAWAYQILRNKIGNHFRRDRVRQRLRSGGSEVDVAAAGVVDPDTRLTLVRCLRKLIEVNPRYARVLNLIHLGYNTEEICRRMKLTRSNLYSIVSRARALLSDCVFGEERSK